jgi:hypothetical protein
MFAFLTAKVDEAKGNLSRLSIDLDELVPVTNEERAERGDLDSLASRGRKSPVRQAADDEIDTDEIDPFLAEVRPRQLQLPAQQLHTSPTDSQQQPQLQPFNLPFAATFAATAWVNGAGDILNVAKTRISEGAEAARQLALKVRASTQNISRQSSECSLIDNVRDQLGLRASAAATHTGLLYR